MRWRCFGGNGLHSIIFETPRFDLYETNYARRTHGDEIEFAGARLHASAQHPVEFTYQQKCRKCFAASSVALGSLAVAALTGHCQGYRHYHFDS